MQPKHHVSYNDVIVPYNCTYSDFRTVQGVDVFLLVAGFCSAVGENEQWNFG